MIACSALLCVRFVILSQVIYLISFIQVIYKYKSPQLSTLVLQSVHFSLPSSESHALSSLSAAVVPPALHTFLALHACKHIPGHHRGNKECEDVLAKIVLGTVPVHVGLKLCTDIYS